MLIWIGTAGGCALLPILVLVLAGSRDTNPSADKTERPEVTPPRVVVSETQPVEPKAADPAENSRENAVRIPRTEEQAPPVTKSQARADQEPGTADGKTQAHKLIATARASVEKAGKLLGIQLKEEREKEYAVAVDAYTKALELYPQWRIDEADAGNPWAVAKARIERATLWSSMARGDKAREEYSAAVAGAGRKSPDLTSYLLMLIGDSYCGEKNWIAAEESYLRAQKTGLYGDRKKLVPEKLKNVKPLADQQRKEPQGGQR